MRVRFLTDQEEAAIRETIVKRCPRNLPAFEFSIHTGARSNEQFGVRWEDVDFERRTVRLKNKRAENAKYRFVR